jgi:hypothetical protein
MRMQRWGIAALIAAMSSTAALASTGASLTLTGDGVDLDMSIDTSTATFDVGSFDVALAPGATQQETFTYTVRVTDDGQAAARTWTFCTPVTYTDCGPPATGLEQAYASLWIGRDPASGTDNDYWIDDTMSFNSFQSVTGTPGLYTGTIDYTATNTSSWLPQFTTVYVLGAVFADVSAVPEPAAWQLLALALGLGLAGMAARRRVRPARVSRD